MADALARIHCDILITLGRYDSGLEGVSKLYAKKREAKSKLHENLGSVTREAVLMLGRKEDR